MILNMIKNIYMFCHHLQGDFSKYKGNFLSCIQVKKIKSAEESVRPQEETGSGRTGEMS